jgi:hypothetical protein
MTILFSNVWCYKRIVGEIKYEFTIVILLLNKILLEMFLKLRTFYHFFLSICFLLDWTRTMWVFALICTSCPLLIFIQNISFNGNDEREWIDQLYLSGRGFEDQISWPGQGIGFPAKCQSFYFCYKTYIPRVLLKNTHHSYSFV